MRALLILFLALGTTGCAGCLPGDGGVISIQTHLPQYGRVAGGDVLDVCEFPQGDVDLERPFQIDLGELGASGQLQLGGRRPNDLKIGVIFENAGDKDILFQEVEVRWKTGGVVSDPFMLRTISIDVPGKGSSRHAVPLLTSDAERQVVIDTVRSIEGLEDTQIVAFQVELRFRGIDDNYFEVISLPLFFEVQACVACGDDLALTPMCQQAPPGWEF